MDNQHKLIKGYRDLTQDEIDLMNASIDKRWLIIAKTDLQKGFMSLIRSIAKPETF